MSDKKNYPSHKIFQIRDRGEDKKAVWTEVGIGFVNRDDSINLIFNAVPLNGKVQVRIFEPKNTEDA